MKKEIEILNEWPDNIYKNKNHIGCLQLPILKLLSQKDDWVSRGDLIKHLSQYGEFSRFKLSLDHLFSHRFGRGDEQEILNKFIEHDAQVSGDKKNKYKIKDNLRDDLKKFLSTYNQNIEELIQKRLDWVARNGKEPSKFKRDIFKNSNNTSNKSLNQILYGPPGTGKTYSTITKALDIIGSDYDKNNRADAKEKFRQLQQEGQIEFVTFHQSYGYEEFLEGIKPKTEDGQVTYSVEDGVFKRICSRAKGVKNNSAINYVNDISKSNIWKISLGDSQNAEENHIYNYCIDNSVILLGWGNYKDFSGCKTKEDILKIIDNPDASSFTATAINIFINQMQKGDIVLVSYGNKKLRAIGEITDDYKYLNDDNLASFVQSRGVKWLINAEEPFNYEEVLKKQFSQQSIYNIKDNVKIDSLQNLLTNNKENNEGKNFVIIIDEINRGNISKIFGELITLIEPSKRLGMEDEITLKLPYSGDKFGVPQNLYIIGTMNTADRSIALMDTALRRRFEFIEIMPKPELLKTDKDGIIIDGVNIKKMLEIINKRIEYLYDRDHTIGHAYLMELKNEENRNKTKLDNIFKNKIIPLLQEYFYDEWEKIELVLGSGFIERVPFDSSIFSNTNSEHIEDAKYCYKILESFTYRDFINKTTTEEVVESNDE